MATPTYDLIDSSVLGATATDVTFSSVSGYRDLLVVADVLSSASTVNVGLRLNSDSGNSYPYVAMYGDSFGADSTASTTNRMPLTVRGDTLPTTSERGLFIANLFDVDVTDKHTSILVRANNGAGQSVEATAGRWANTSAVTSVSIVAVTNGFAASSRFYLYGIVG